MYSPPTPLSNMGSPMSSASRSLDFEIERNVKQPYVTHSKTAKRQSQDYENEMVFRNNVLALLSAKTRPFTVSGRIPFDPSTLILFFRSKSGVAHSLDFPINTDHDTPPALDVLIAACKPHPLAENDAFSDRESLFFPPNLPLTANLEIANHPILEAVRNTLFPSLPTGHYLTVVRDQLEVIVSGGGMAPQPRSLRNDGRVATLCITLPVRFRGGELVIRDPSGNGEKFNGRGGKPGDMEWTAFVADCDYEVEKVTKGCKVSISYAVFLKSFGPSGLLPDPLIAPSDNFLDLLSPVLNQSRGRKIAFYLTHDYGVNPSESLAESLAPNLKGGDSITYHAMKVFKLNPELHWTAGGYIWPVERTVEVASEIPETPTVTRQSFPPVIPPMHGAFSMYGAPPPPQEEPGSMRSRVEESGAVPLAEAEIFILNDYWSSPGPVGKERVPFISGGELEKLVVNVLLVVYVP